MPERTDHRPEGFLPAPGGPDSVFGPDTNAGGMATVCHGPYIERLPVCNLTIGEVRSRFGDRLDIDPESQAVIDGNAVGDDTVVQADQLLTFVRKAGEKG